MQYGHIGRARWGISTLALISAVGFAVPAVAQVNEILITATRRAGTTVQDVPLSVTAYGGDTLDNAGIKSVKDLVQLAPSFQFYTGQSNSSGTTAYIRGVGTGGDNPGFESAVGFFIDGVYRNRSGVALSDLPGVDRVELLRGPQGTLFGKNTSAGAISVITAAPSFKPSFFGFGSMSNYNGWEGNLGYTGPIVADKVAIRLDIDQRQHDGYIRDIRGARDFNDQNHWYARGQLLAEFAEDSSLRIILDTSESKEACCAGVTFIKGAISAAVIDGLKPLTPGLLGFQTFDPSERKTTVTPGRAFGDHIKEMGASAEYDGKIGGLNFTSITSYRRWKAARTQDVDFSDADLGYRPGYKTGFNTFTQELRLQGKSGALDWLIGGYYANEVLPLTDDVRLGADYRHYIDGTAAGLSAAAGLGARSFYGSIPGTTPTLVQAVYSQLLATLDPALAATVGPGLSPVAANAFGTALAASGPSDGNGEQANVWKQTTNSTAIFTHNQITLADDLLLTLGARYNMERKKMTGTVNNILPSCNVFQTYAGVASAAAGYRPNPALPAATRAALLSLQSNFLQTYALMCPAPLDPVENGTYHNSLSENELTGTAALSYKLRENLMFWGSYSRGYKAGGFNLDSQGFSVLPFSTTAPSASQLQFRPEKVDALEVGFKWSPVPDSAINLSIFHESIEDYQENAFSGFSFVTFNVAKSISQGVELEVAHEIFKGLVVQGGITYLDAFFDSTTPSPTAGQPALVNKGDRFDRSPKWTVAGSANWTKPINDALQFTWSVDGRWSTKYQEQTLSSRNPATDQPAYAVFNTLVGIGAPDGEWTISAFAKNVFDQFYRKGTFAATLQAGAYVAYPGDPRIFGAMLRFKM